MKHPGMLINPDTVMYDDDDVISLGEPDDPLEFPSDNDIQQQPRSPSLENNSIVAAELVPHQEASKVSQDSKQTPDDSRNSRKRQSSQDDVHDKALKDTRRTHAENRESYTLTEKSSQKALVSTTTTTTSSTITTQNGSAKEPKPSHSPNERNGPNYDRRNGSDGEHQDTTPTTKSDPQDSTPPPPAHSSVSVPQSTDKVTSDEQNVDDYSSKSPKSGSKASKTVSAGRRSFVNAFGMKMELTDGNLREEVKAEARGRHSRHADYHDDPYTYRRHDAPTNTHTTSPPRSREYRSFSSLHESSKHLDDYRSSSNRDDRWNRHGDRPREELSKLSMWPSHNKNLNNNNNNSNNKDDKNDTDNNERRGSRDYELPPPSKQLRDDATGFYERRSDFQAPASYDRNRHHNSLPRPSNDDKERRPASIKPDDPSQNIRKSISRDDSRYSPFTNPSNEGNKSASQNGRPSDRQQSNDKAELPSKPKSLNAKPASSDQDGQPNVYSSKVNDKDRRKNKSPSSVDSRTNIPEKTPLSNAGKQQDQGSFTSSSGRGTYERRRPNNDETTKHRDSPELSSRSRLNTDTPPLSDRGSYQRPDPLSDRGSDKDLPPLKSRRLEDDRSSKKLREYDHDRERKREHKESRYPPRESDKNYSRNRERERDRAPERGRELEREEDKGRVRSSRFEKGRPQSRLTPPPLAATTPTPPQQPQQLQRDYERSRRQIRELDEPKRKRRSRSRSMEGRGHHPRRIPEPGYDKLKRPELSRSSSKSAHGLTNSKSENDRGQQREERSRYRW